MTIPTYGVNPLYQAHIRLLLIGEIEKGLSDIEAGRLTNAKGALKKIKKHRREKQPSP